METIYSTFTTKSFTEREEGTFEGYAATYGNIDRMGHIIKKGAFTESLEKSGGNLKLFWNHMHYGSVDNFIGTVKAEEDNKGVRVKAKFFLDKQTAKEVYHHVKRGEIDSMSIGFNVSDSKFIDKIIDGKEKTVWEIKKGDLLEVSAVNIPANPKATINPATVKSYNLPKTIREAESCLRDVGFSGKQAKELISTIKSFEGFKTNDNNPEIAEIKSFFTNLKQELNYG